MALTNPDPLRYPGNAPTTGGTQASPGADTSAATAWIQQQPWYRETLAKWGNPKTLTLGQRGYLARTAQQAGLNPDFGINTDGSVEDWSTPTGSKIALAAFFAWAGATELGLLPNGAAASGASGGSASLGPSTAANMSATDAAMNGSTVPESLLPAGGSATTALGPSTPENMNATQQAMNGSNVPSSLSAATNALKGGTVDNVIKALTTLSAAFGGRAIANNAAGNAVPPQLTDLLNQSVQRQKELAPLGTAATSGMYQMLPDFAKTPQSLDGAKTLLGVK